MTRDRYLLYAAAFLRATGVGMSGVLVGLYAAELGLHPARVGAVISARLLGVALCTLAVAGMTSLGVLAYAVLSARAREAGAKVRERRPVSPESRRRIGGLAALFAMDSVGGGFLTTALLSYWFFRRFGVGEEPLAPLFLLARIANGLSHLAAAWLARRIGLLRTMVFTHLPSSLLLLTVPIASSFPLAALLFLVRECLVEMDVPTRQSYVVAVVAPSERAAAAGATNLVPTAGRGGAPPPWGAARAGAARSAPPAAGGAGSKRR